MDWLLEVVTKPQWFIFSLYGLIILFGLIAGISLITLRDVIYPLTLRELFSWIAFRLRKYWLSNKEIESNPVTDQENNADNNEQVMHPRIMGIFREIKSPKILSGTRSTQEYDKSDSPFPKPSHSPDSTTGESGNQPKARRTLDFNCTHVLLLHYIFPAKS